MGGGGEEISEGAAVSVPCVTGEGVRMGGGGEEISEGAAVSVPCVTGEGVIWVIV